MKLEFLQLLAPYQLLKNQLKYLLRLGSFGIGLEKFLKFLILRVSSLFYRNAQKETSDRKLENHQKNQPKYNEHLFSFLDTIHQEDPIEEIIVFDICDLPTVLEFSDPQGIRTLIR